jgi:hypothetical protein
MTGLIRCPLPTQALRRWAAFLPPTCGYFLGKFY